MGMRSRTAAGNLGGVDEPPPAPADAEQPGPRRCDGRWIVGGGRAPEPPREPPARRCGIDPGNRGRAAALLGKMAARIQQYIGDRVPDLARSPQHVDVAAITEHAAGASKHAVHAARKARGDRLEPAREVPRATRLDDQVHVVALDRIMHETKSFPLARLAPASLQLGHQLRSPERGNVLPHPERDVTWMTRRQRFSSPVRIAS